MTVQYMLAPVPYSCSRSLAQRTLAYPRTKVKESGTIKRVWTNYYSSAGTIAVGAVSCEASRSAPTH